MTRRLRFAALAAVVALALGACANNDAKESDVVNAMEDAGLETEQAECIGSAMQEEFGDDQGLFNDVADAVDTDDFPQGDSADYPDGTAPVIEAILADCIEGESPSAGEGDGSEADTTESTEATEGDATTTTAADAAG